MQQLRFCPKCGRETLKFEGQKFTCSHCDYNYYHNIAAAVAVIIRNGEKVLLTRRNQDPKKGLLDLAGGFVDQGETAEQACARELHEELGLEVKQSRLKYLCSKPNTYFYKEILYYTLDLFFEYNLEGEEQFSLATDEISELVWLRREELKIEELAFESQEEFFKDYCPQ
ncbi:MAG: NUDIX domain-containing protein [Chryseobacterium sp.]|nr:MAG: NUDIX domain-containing protein [Chryseobacterium sp.]